MRPRQALAILIAVATMAVGLPARAEPDAPPGYEAAFSKGTAHFDKSEWAEARAAFQKAYLLAPRPVLLFNIASTYRREGSLVEARDYYQRFLESGSGNDALEEIARTVIATIDAGTAAAAQAAEKPAAATTTAAPTETTTVARSGGVARRPRAWLLASGYGSATVGAALVGWGIRNRHRADELEASAVASPGAVASPPSNTGLILGSGLVLVGLGVAGTISAIVYDEPANDRETPLVARWQPWAALAGVSGVVGGYFAYKFSSTRSDLAAVIEDSAAHDFSEAEALEDQAHHEGLVANIALGVAGASAAAAITAFVLDATRAEAPVVEPIATGDRVGLSLVGHF